jgi:hypothetical protein
VGDNDPSVSGRQKLIPLPAEEIWHFQTQEQVRRFAVERSKEVTPWADNGVTIPVVQRPRHVKLISHLGNQEEVPKQHCNTKHGLIANHDDVWRYCQELCHIINTLKSSVYTVIQERLITKQGFQDLLAEPNQKKQELEDKLVQYGRPGDS